MLLNPIRHAWFVVLVTVLALRGLAGAAAPATHTMLLPGDVSWGEPPPALPRGSQVAVLYGDPSKPGMFVIRAKMPAGYEIPAHSHPSDETVTVMSGTFKMGMGDRLDAAAATPLPPGAFAMMPAGSNHFAIAETDAVIQVVGVGPLVFNYVDPAKDPRNAK